ncbi:CYTH domain-containing protein [Lacticaseibacillus sp. GG6-2]
MSIEAEQEFKALLPAAQVVTLLSLYTFADPFTQTNRYFDTVDEALRQRGCGLRTRQFVDHAEQTLKVPAGPDRKLLEYTDPIAGNMLVAGGQVEAEVVSLGVDFKSLRPFAEATTTRRLAQLPAGLLTLDQTQYPDGFSDWEVELEYHDAATAQNFWKRLGKQLQLTFSAPQNKIQRAKVHTRAK